MSGIPESEKERINAESLQRAFREGLFEGLKHPCPAVITKVQEIVRAYDLCETCRKKATCPRISKNEHAVAEGGHGCHDCARFNYPCCPCDESILPIPFGCLSWLPINEEA